ncbi:adenylyl-sulfate kinase [Variovorax sp. H27-G14]|uniref:adenylyl-sulfate kinase n=1 Tax=Variovorax sp. H27-G14 TaxID=3111914 RepID=UPI0038FCD640
MFFNNLSGDLSSVRCIWLTGLSGAGKSTIAGQLHQRLSAQGLASCVLDGDRLRTGLNADLGFSEADRIENVRRVGEVAKLMAEAGLIVLVAVISPYREQRRLARGLFAEGEFVEVFVDAPLLECERRDTKGLYAKARRGELKNFTGIDSEYQAPEAPELRLSTVEMDAQTCVALVLRRLGLTD